MADRLAGEDARLRYELGLTELLFELLLDGQISYDELRELSPEERADRFVRSFRERFNDDELESLPRALSAGAQPEELLTLGVCGLTCEGEDLQVVTLDELRQRMKGVVELRARSRTSKWLRKYAAWLVRESRRRKGLAC